MKSIPFPRNPHGERLCQLFTYWWQWLEAPLNGSNITPWTTNTKYKLRPRSLWKRHQDTATLIGVRFGSSTQYAMLDIDVNSPYCNPDGMAQIRDALEVVGIVRTVAIRSSWSGGIHLYCPLPQAFPSFSVACLLRQAVEAQGLTVAPGQLELFPNQKPFAASWKGEFTEYNGHRLPLQPATGSCLLDTDLNPIPGGDNLALFFAQWDNAVLLNDRDDIADALQIARANRRRRGRQRTSKRLQAWKDDMAREISEGWTGPGQTNALLKTIGTYGRVFERLGGAELLDYVLTVANQCPGYLEWCRHQHEICKRAIAWCHAIEKFYWPYDAAPLRGPKTATPNQQRADDARQRIQRAWSQIQFLYANGDSVKHMANHLAQVAHCSLTTLYKHLDIWHPQPQAKPPVTPHPEGDTADLATIQRLIRESLESVGTRSVTPNRGGNEACNLKSPSKNSSSGGGKDGGVGEGKGFSTGWLPALDWTQGAVGDV